MIRRKFKAQEGQTLVEFALVVPLLLLIVFGIIQFGVAFNDYLSLTDGVRAGARKAAVSRHENDPIEATKAAVRRSASDLDPSEDKLRIQVSSSWRHGEDVVVTASYPFEISLLGKVVHSGRLESKTTERVE